MRKRTPEQELMELCEKIRREIDHWEDINQNGCYDPFWPDGLNYEFNQEPHHI